MKSIRLAALATAALLPASLHAGEEPVLVVTGTRAPDPVAADRIGSSITVIDAATMQRRQVRDVAEVLRDVPGVAVGAVPGQTQIRLRGAEANHTLVLVDGIEVSDPYSGEFDFGTLVADEAARIEVLRGQQSAIYGSDAIGGVIHYITLSGREAPGSSARIEAGTQGTLNGALRLAGVEGAFDYALSATVDTTDGFPGARGGTRDLKDDNAAVSLKTNFVPADNAKLTAVVRYARTWADFNDADYDPASPTFGYQVDSPGSRYENEALYALLRGEVGLLDDRWKHAVTAQIADTTRDGYNAFGRSYGSEGQRLKGSYETSFLIDSGTLHHRVTAAADVERERFRNNDPSGFAFTGRRRVDNIGLVGQYELFIGDNASVGASLRRDWNDRFADTTTYRVQGSYALTTGTRLRAAAGSGVKNPSFYELFGYSDGRFIGNPDLKPEKSTGWEAGVDQTFLGGKGTVGVTYFDSRLKDEIFTDYPAPTYVATPANRATSSRQHGVEVSASAQLSPAWLVSGSYTWLDAKEDGTREVRRPKHTASAAVAWQAFAERGGITLVARYNGAAQDLAYIDPSYVPVRVRLDDYLLVNLNVEYEVADGIGLFARAENLANERYEDVFSFPGVGRSFTAGLRARF